ncbi:MAG: ribulose-phosphate 3-epimerase [Bacilli bacterium]|nr:ribulose-phosphate 3-epimerase [Bacilli bacterium]MBR4672130.1 ribulose-phosphate 3-epimerase [Bacilli bacterium]
MKKVSVSFLSSKDEQKDILKIDRTSADYIHVDVMDGKFVKKKYKPYKMLYKMGNTINKRLDVHLMEKNPLKNINFFASLNTEYITVHVELPKVEKYLDLIREYGIKCGLAINPDTDVSVLLPYLPKIDLIIIMGVFPGKGGQEFIDDTIKKILRIKKMIVSKKARVKISVDGGVNAEVAKRLDFVDIIVTGNYVTSSDDFETAIETVRANASINENKGKEKAAKRKKEESE